MFKLCCTLNIAYQSQLSRQSAEILDSHDIHSRAQGYLNRAEYNPSDGNNSQHWHGQDRASLGKWQGHARDISSRAQGHLNRGEYVPNGDNNLQRWHGQDRASLG